ncbi:SSF1 protein, partial [Crypturellus soui]|nr:SSF1 protein [Crypturellus soui]
QSRQQRRLRAAARLRAQDAFPRVPHSLVLHRGRPGRSVRQLERDLRRVMEPYTARALRV